MNTRNEATVLGLPVSVYPILDEWYQEETGRSAYLEELEKMSQHEEGAPFCWYHAERLLKKFARDNGLCN